MVSLLSSSVGNFTFRHIKETTCPNLLRNVLPSSRLYNERALTKIYLTTTVPAKIPSDKVVQNQGDLRCQPTRPRNCPKLCQKV